VTASVIVAPAATERNLQPDVPIPLPTTKDTAAYRHLTLGHPTGSILLFRIVDWFDLRSSDLRLLSEHTDVPFRLPWGSTSLSHQLVSSYLRQLAVPATQ
jgi:hypothetical protein